MRCECKWDCPLPRFSKNFHWQMYDVGAGLQRGLKVYNKVTSDFACFNCILSAKNEHARIQSGWGGGITNSLGFYGPQWKILGGKV